MHTTQLINRTSTPSRRIANACLASCRQLLSQMQKVKNAILAEFRVMAGADEHLLRLALNEAEALARQTHYPHLVCPMLALEKAESVRNWHARQQTFRETPSSNLRLPFVSTH